MGRRIGLIGGILVLIVLFFAVNMLVGVGVRGARLDLTDGHLFTLTSGSKAIAQGFDEPVKLTLYYSSKLAQGVPDFQSYYPRVHELLEEYERISGGKVKLEVVDPQPFSDAEDKAVAAGLQGIPVNAAGENIYFGLVGTNSTNTQETIPVFDSRREQFLEYDVSRLLYSLAHPKKKVVGVISSLEITGGFTFDPRTRQPQRTPAWQVIEEARKTFEVRSLGAQVKTIPDDVDVLMLVHPQKLDDATLYAIDQFVMKGGRLMAFVDPMCENQETQQGQMEDRSSHLEKLLDAWGVQVDPGKLAADKNLALPVQMGTPSRPEVVPFVVWLKLTKDQMSKDDPITGQLEKINIGSAGCIKPKEAPKPEGGKPAPAQGPKATIVPLLKTTDEASELPAEMMMFQPDPKSMLSSFTAGKEALVLAARLSGQVNSAFPDGAPPPAAGAAATPPPAPGLTKSNGSINLILVADADMLANGLWVRQQNFLGQTFASKMADNGDFVINALDNLSGSTELMSVRARQGEQRPFTLVEKMQKSAQESYQAKEKELEAKLEETQQKLQALQAKKGQDQEFVLSAEQQAEVEKFRKDYADTRKKLRDVKLSLNQGIEGLGTRLKFINVGLIPLVVSVGAVGLGAIRASRRRRTKRS